MADDEIYKPWIVPEPPSITETLVGDRTEAAADYAEQAVAAALAGIDHLVTAVLDDSTAWPTIGDPTFEGSPPSLGSRPSPQRPSLDDLDYQAPLRESVETLMRELQLSEISLESVTTPVLQAVSPVLDFPAPPTDLLPDIGLDPPALNDPSLPAAPVLDLPAVPNLNDIEIPSAPAIDLPEFSALPPTADLQPPDHQLIFHEAAYDSALANAMGAKLLTAMQNGGTGLGSAVEEALWERARARQQSENLRLYSEAELYFAARGCEEPPGALAARLGEASREIARANDQISYEIMIEQARLALSNDQFVVTQTVAIEKALMDYANAVNDRGLAAAKAVVESAVAIFAARVSYFQAQQEAYKVEAQVFDSLIRAQLAKTEIFKSQIEGARLVGEMQELAITLYAERVKAQESVIGLYTAEMAGAKIAAEIEGLKIAQFKAIIEGQVAQIQGVTAKMNLYQAQIAGEAEKVKVYGVQVEAFKSETEAAKVRADIEIAEAEALLKKNQEQIAVLVQTIDMYKADVTAAAAEVDAEAKIATAKADLYEADVKALDSWIDGSTDIYGEQTKRAIAQAEVAVKNAEILTQRAISQAEISAKVSVSASEMATQIAAAAISAVTTSTSMGHHTSDNTSSSYSSSSVDSNITSSSSSSSHNRNININE